MSTQLLAWTLLSLGDVHAYDKYLPLIPNGRNVKDCDGADHLGVGHIRSAGSGPRNAFGIDFAAAGYKWSQELCEKDSDGDGVINGVELGDPRCIWQEGQTPEFNLAITHPGINCATRHCDTDGSQASVLSSDGTEPKRGCDKFEYKNENIFRYTLSMGSHEVLNGTSYMLQALQYTGERSMALTKFEWKIDDKRVVHHKLLYRCTKDQSSEYGTPTEKVVMPCVDLLMAWAIGGSDFCMPEDLTIAIEPDEFFMLEIHYDNPNNIPGIMDESGMILVGIENKNTGFTTTKASIITVGPLSALTVPPQLPVFVAELNMSASSLRIPEGEIVKVFAFGNHLHALGRQQWLTIMDDATGKEEGELGCLTNFDFDLQEVQLMDELFELKSTQKMRLTCQFDSMSRDEPTLGGDKSEDEMCVMLLLYYTDKDEVKLPPTIGVRANAIVTHTKVYNKKCGCPIGGTLPIDDSSNREKMLLYHGALMIIAWILLLPAGASAPVFGKAVFGAPLWFQVHQTLQMIGGIVCLVAFGIAFSQVAEGAHFSTKHMGIGLIIVMVTSLQLVGGLCRPHTPAAGEAPSTTRVEWLWLHRVLGGSLLLVCLLQCIQGIGMYGDFYATTGNLYGLYMGCLVVVIICVAVLASKSRGAGFKQMNDDVEIETVS